MHILRYILCHGLLICTLHVQAQRETFRMGSAPVKSVEEIQKLNGPLKAEETLKLIRNPATPATKEVYDLIDESLSLAQDAERADIISGLLCGKAVLRLQQTDTASALQLLQKAENYFPRITDKRFQDNALNSLAIGFLRAGNADKAIEYNLKILSLYDDTPENRMRRLFSFRNLSNAYSRTNRNTEASKAMETALQYASQTNNETLLQDTKLAAASMYAGMNDYKRSFGILKDVIPSINRLPAKAAEALFIVLADTYQKQGEFTKANEYYRKTINSSNPNISLRSYLPLIFNHYKNGEKDSVANYFTAVQKLAFPFQKTTAPYYLAAAEYAEVKGNISERVRLLRKASAFAKTSSAGAEALIQLGKYFSDLGKKDSADSYLSAAVTNKLLKTDPVLYGNYLSTVKQHQLRYKATDSLISVLNAELQLKDSMQQSNMFSVTKDLETRYQVAEKEFKLQQLAQQRKLDALKQQKQQQQLWLGILSLTIVLGLLGALAYVLYSRRKQAEKIHALELSSLKNKHQLELMQALDKAQEKERRNIADKLHDEVGAMLSVLKLNLTSVGKLKLPQADKSLETGLNILDSLAGEIRNLSHTLMPVVVEKYGMIRGIKDLITQINNAGKLKVELIVTGFENEQSISVNQQMHVYRIVQELLNNIIKHSKATNALVQLVEHDEAVSLVIEDNGSGLSTTDKAGNGLHVLNSKIMLLNGEMSVESESGNGTCFIIEIPKNVNTPLLYEKNGNHISG